jgi:cell division protein FtsW (lipid II flippase)
MLIYFMGIWNILLIFGIFYDHFVHCVFIWYSFSGFGIMHQEILATLVVLVLAAWHSGHRVNLQDRRSRVRIPPGCTYVRFLGLNTLQCCCENLMCLVILCT